MVDVLILYCVVMYLCFDATLIHSSSQLYNLEANDALAEFLDVQSVTGLQLSLNRARKLASTIRMVRMMTLVG